MSLFFVNSACDLSMEIIKSLGIELINLPYSINDKRFQLGDDFDSNKFFSKLRKGVVLSTASFTEDDYLQIFQPILESQEDIIYVYSSSNILDSTAIENVRDLLSESFPDRKIAFINCKNFSAGYGTIAYLLAMQYRSGKSVEEIVDYSYKIIDEIAMYMVVDSLETLDILDKVDSNVVSGTALNIKPIINVDIDGNFQVIDKVSGKKKSINKLVEIIRQTGENIVDYPIMITHAGDEKNALDISNRLKEYLGEDLKVFVSYMTPVCSAVVGLGAISVSFHVHKKNH